MRVTMNNILHNHPYVITGTGSATGIASLASDPTTFAPIATLSGRFPVFYMFCEGSIMLLTILTMAVSLYLAMPRFVGMFRRVKLAPWRDDLRPQNCRTDKMPENQIASGVHSEEEDAQPVISSGRDNEGD